MFTRRQLRVKALQVLYSYFQDERKDVKHVRNQLESSFEKLYNLYVCQLLIFSELAHLDEVTLQDVELKYLPQPEDRRTTQRLYDNSAIKLIENNPELNEYARKKKISWKEQQDLIQSLYHSIKKSEEYKHYQSTELNFEVEKNFLINIYLKQVLASDRFQNYFEDINLYWIDDAGVIKNLVIKTIKSLGEGNEKILQPLFRNEKDDREFVSNLLLKTIEHEKEFEKDIAERTKNWELERLALIDIILIKMTLTEVLYFPAVPVKVSMNEYIDIAKVYSTPKSSIFINGVIDRLVNEKKQAGLINKEGRGLVNE